MAKTETKTAVAPQGIRVSALAKEFGIQSKVLLERAQELKIDVKNASSFLTKGQADRLKAKFGAGDLLRAEAEKKKTAISKKAKEKEADNASRMMEAVSDVSDSQAMEAVEAPEAEAETYEAPVAEAQPAETVEAEAPSLATTGMAAISDEPITEAFPVEVAPAAQPPVATEEAPAVQEAAAEAPATEPAAASEPSIPVKMLRAGPELIKPVQRNNSDARFGVVISADQAKQIHGEVPQRGGKGKPAAKGPQQVESKAVDDFKAQVSYPKLPEVAFTDEEDGRPRTGGGTGGGPGGPGGANRRGRGMPRRGGQPSGPRHGRALLQEDDRFRGRGKKYKAPKQQTPVVPRTGKAEVTSPVTIKSLCEALGIKAATLIGKFFTEGRIVKINDIVSDEEAELYASEFDPLKFGITIKKARDVEEEMLSAADEPDKPEDLLPRAPIVTIMGHVDHGKTSLLDYIRKSNVAGGEAGGITQHIRAYRVHRPAGDIVFLDTPGHKAFTEMRARGANVTDLVILVVSAVDGVMPQTEEAINHVKAAGKILMVALNKIDLPEANVDKVKGQLAAKEIFVEGYGGTVGCVEVSAKTGKGVNDLLDRILLESEVLNLKANPNKRAIGTVIEAHKDQGRGIVATVMVQEGTLSQGDVLVCGHAYGSVRQLVNDVGKTIDAAGPAVPVLITGLNEVPLAGERFHCLEDIKTAAEIAENRAMLLRQEGLSARHAVTLENLHDLIAQGEVAALKLILKVDVMGSLQPVEQAMIELATTEARVQILHSAVGAVNETDVHLADASEAIIIGFGVSADPGARRLAEARGVEIRTYSIIYEVVDDMRKALEGMLKPMDKEAIQGHAEIRQIFKISKKGNIAGCRVTDGTITRNNQIRILRDSAPIWTGKLSSLMRVKDDVKEVRDGFECGMKFDGYDDIKIGDVVEAFTVEKIARTLDGKPA